MDDFKESPIPWNTEAHITCAISFQCTKIWTNWNVPLIQWYAIATPVTEMCI
jgi:hypothetical protein